jgi:alkylresorcinol/alkylpyrone synthase
MICIKSVGTALPKYSCDNQAIEWAGNEWLGESSERDLFLRFVRSSQTQKRFFVRPVEKILNYAGQEERALIFEEEAPKLGTESAAQAIKTAKISATDISSFVFTSCTCPSIPSVDGQIVENLQLNNSISRVPVYQFGCAGGVQGLALASKLAGTTQHVLLTSVELCSLIYHRNDHSAGHLVGAAIFGDGSASVVVGPSNQGLEFISSRSFLIPKTRHLMGYNIYDDGAHLRLDKKLPEVLSSVVEGIVEDFLNDNELSFKEINSWLFHPGGKKILDQLEKIFSLKAEQSLWSRTILSKFGNLSSSTVLFVIKEYLETAKYKIGDFVLLIGIGPGLTLEMILFRHR